MTLKLSTTNWVDHCFSTWTMLDHTQMSGYAKESSMTLPENWTVLCSPPTWDFSVAIYPPSTGKAFTAKYHFIIISSPRQICIIGKFKLFDGRTDSGRSDQLHYAGATAFTSATIRSRLRLGQRHWRNIRHMGSSKVSLCHSCILVDRWHFRTVCIRYGKLQLAGQQHRRVRWPIVWQSSSRSVRQHSGAINRWRRFGTGGTVQYLSTVEH